MTPLNRCVAACAKDAPRRSPLLDASGVARAPCPARAQFRAVTRQSQHLASSAHRLIPAPLGESCHARRCGRRQNWRESDGVSPAPPGRSAAAHSEARLFEPQRTLAAHQSLSEGATPRRYTQLDHDPGSFAHVQVYPKSRDQHFGTLHSTRDAGGLAVGPDQALRDGAEEWLSGATSGSSPRAIR